MARKTPKDGKADDIESWPVERCFEELERIVAALENQTTSLEESLKLFERGIALSNRCSRELTAVEQKIRMIVEKADGSAGLVPFDTGEETS